MNNKINCFREIGNFRLDPKKKVLSFQDKPIDIPLKEIELLCVLTENSGELVTKEELLNRVWADSFVEESNLTRHIYRLRKMFAKYGESADIIQNVPRRGYRFIADVKIVENSIQNSGESKITKPQVSSNQNFAFERQGNVIAVAKWQVEPQENFNADTERRNFPELVSVPNVSNYLFGREQEIETIKNLVSRDDVRLVTLTGAGGTGKTSLAQQIANRFLLEFSDGVFFVELATVHTTELVVPAIAQALDVKEATEKNLIENLKSFLRERKILLILDNFEQIVSSAPIISELLAASTRLKILVTSRILLNLSKENELIVPTLAFPPADFAEKSDDKISNFPAVKLFVERARKVKSNFVLTDENAFVVAEICAKLDGLPLGIELAAARIKLLSPAAILKRLKKPLQLLTSKTQNLPARQRTMRDTIAWSFDLLDEKEKMLFTRLSVFEGGFTVEAAEAVCGEADEMEVLNGLESLIDNNLLRRIEDNTGEMRLLFLETIREFSAEKLAENAEEETDMRQRHLLFYLASAKQFERELMGAEQVILLNQMESERSNFRAALDWGKKTNSEDELKLAAALGSLWTFRGYPSEGIERLTEALARNPHTVSALQAKALAWLGQLIWVKGDYVKAIAVCEQSLKLARQINYPIMIGRSLFVLGMSHWYHYGDDQWAITYLEEASNLFRELNFDTGIVFTLVVLAAIYQTKGNLSHAEQILDESLAAAKRTGNNLALSIAKVNYGRLEIAKGNLSRAKNLCQESLRLRGELSDRWGFVQCLEPLAAVAIKEGNANRAAQMLGAIDLLLESFGASLPLIFRADHESNVADTRAALAEKTFAESFAKGRKLSMQEILNLAGE